MSILWYYDNKFLKQDIIIKKKDPCDCFVVSAFSNHGWFSYVLNTTDYYNYYSSALLTLSFM